MYIDGEEIGDYLQENDAWLVAQGDAGNANVLHVMRDDRFGREMGTIVREWSLERALPGQEPEPFPDDEPSEWFPPLVDMAERDAGTALDFTGPDGDGRYEATADGVTYVITPSITVAMSGAEAHEVGTPSMAEAYGILCHEIEAACGTGIRERLDDADQSQLWEIDSNGRTDVGYYLGPVYTDDGAFELDAYGEQIVIRYDEVDDLRETTPEEHPELFS